MEDFVTYEVAKKLKEKGFNQKTRGGYLPPFTGLHIAFVEKGWIKVNGYPAPTIAQAMKWLMEENINVSIYPYYDKNVSVCWCYDIRTPVNRVEISSNIKQSGFDSYESAALAGIEYVLDNLI